MSSKRARRKKRKQDLNSNNPNKIKKEEPVKEEYPVKKLPGQTLIRTGSIFLLISALVSAFVVWQAVRSLNQMSEEELVAMTAAAHQTPMGYTVLLVLTSIAAVFQMMFGYQIFRNSNNPFYWKTSMTMGIIMACIELGINITSLVLSHDAFNVMMLLYGVAFPLVIVWGSYKNKKFAEDHPGYKVPEPINMF